MKYGKVDLAKEDAKVLARIVRWTDDCASFFRMFAAERFQ